MNEKLFRKKTIDRMSSPEQLDAYIRVANPSVWMILLAIMTLLVGFCVWGVVGHLDTTVSGVAVSENEKVMLYVKEADIAAVGEGMSVKIGDTECSISVIKSQPVEAEGTLSEYAMHVGEIQSGEWMYVIETDGEIADGVYSAEILVEQITPAFFLIN